MIRDADMPLNSGDILTRVTKYNLIRSERMLYIDVHEALAGKLAGKFVAVPNLINIVAVQAYQGTGETEKEALRDCLEKIRDVAFEAIFPQREKP
jgi:hypothetical protein